MTGGEPRLRAWRRETSLMPGRAGRPHPAPGPALTVDVQRGPGYAVVTAAGEIDIATAPKLEEKLSALAAAGHRVVADLGQVSFIDAAGLRVLNRAAGQAAAHGTSLYVVCDRPQILRLFKLTELDRRMILARTLGEALQDLGHADLARLSVAVSRWGHARSAVRCPGRSWPQGRRGHRDPV